MNINIPKLFISSKFITMFKQVLLSTPKVPSGTSSHKIQSRMYHCYRPIKYCDWHKPEGEIYYQPICPTCYEPCRPCLPAITCEKQCKLCSFWEQIKDNCCHFYWPLPPMPMRTEPRVYICKDLRQKQLTPKEAQRRLDTRRFPLNDCDDVPECPEPNWEAIRRTDLL